MRVGLLCVRRHPHLCYGIEIFLGRDVVTDLLTEEYEGVAHFK